MLADAGAEARIVRTAMEAAALAAASVAAGLPYHALLVDRRAATDAGSALSRIREGADLPAAVLIAPGERGTIDALRAAGFDAYLVKPVRRASLVRIVGDIVAARGDFRVDPTDAPPERPAARRPAEAHLRVLVAEDNEINALLVRAVLEGLGHRVVEARDGEAALAAATGDEPFDAILMDLHMPARDGCSAARAIRAHEAATGRPRAAIFALTADVLAETRAAAEAAGIDAVLAKPVSPEALRRALAGLAA
jgi:CheY-like chemotaxis protein